MLEATADLARDARLLHEHVPVEQQIVVVEQLLRVLDLDVAAEQLRQLVRPLAAPGKRFFERARERLAAVDAVRVDREARVLARKALLLLREAQLLAQQIEQIRRVAAVEHRERRLEPDDLRVLAQQPIADRMDTCRTTAGVRALSPCCRTARCAQRSVAMRSARRSISCAARRVKVSSRMRSGATPFSKQMRDPMRERVGLAGAGAGDDEQRPGREAGVLVLAERGCALLGGIQALSRHAVDGAGAHTWTLARSLRAIMAQNCI